MSLDEKTLEELERLEREATPGPWKDEIDAIGHEPGRAPWHVTVVGTEEKGPAYMEVTSLVLSDADRAFIVAARNALPSLLREIREARSERDTALRERDEAREALRQIEIRAAAGAPAVEAPATLSWIARAASNALASRGDEGGEFAKEASTVEGSDTLRANSRDRSSRKGER